MPMDQENRIDALPESPSVVTVDASPTDEAFSVLIAGGGVAALEAVLALRDLAPAASIELVCPERDFMLRPLSVSQPFGGPPPRRLDIARFCSRNGAALRCDRLAEVWSGQGRALLDSGEDLYFDALLIALGARPYDVLDGARAFRGADDVDWLGELLDRLQRGRLRRLAFVVPAPVRWSLPLYELALMTARMLAAKGIDGAEISLVTHERAPLLSLGEEASRRVREMLAASGIETHCGVHAESVVDGTIVCAGGHLIESSEVVTLPGLRVPEIPGIPQGRFGFIPTDSEMCVEGVDRVWAAGDATWFPIKQGGIAAQQADVAAAAIALRSGADVEVPALNPVIRGTLLTGDGPEFFRAALGDESSEEADYPLWWPPGKVAGKWLAPYLAREWSGKPADPLKPLEDLEPSDAEDRSRQHQGGVELALAYADVHALDGEFEPALRWLDIAERLNVVLPAEYERRRADWREIVFSRSPTR